MTVGEADDMKLTKIQTTNIETSLWFLSFFHSNFTWDYILSEFNAH